MAKDLSQLYPWSTESKDRATYKHYKDSCDNFTFSDISKTEDFSKVGKPYLIMFVNGGLKNGYAIPDPVILGQGFQSFQKEDRTDSYSLRLL